MNKDKKELELLMKDFVHKRIRIIPPFYDWDNEDARDIIENLTKKINEIIRRLNKEEEEGEN